MGLKKWIAVNHLRSCPECQSELDKLRIATALVHEVIQDDEPVTSDSIWDDVRLRIAGERIAESTRRPKARRPRFHNWVPALIGITALFILFLVGERMGPIENQSMNNEITSNIPVVEHVDKPGVTVMTFKTDDPKVTIVWFFEEENES